MKILPIQTNNYKIRSNTTYNNINFAANKTIRKSMLTGLASLLGIDIVIKSKQDNVEEEKTISNECKIPQKTNKKELQEIRDRYFCIGKYHQQSIAINCVDKKTELEVRNTLKKYPRDFIECYSTELYEASEESRFWYDVVKDKDLTVIDDMINACYQINEFDYWRKLLIQLVKAKSSLADRKEKLSSEFKMKIDKYIEEVKSNYFKNPEGYRFWYKKWETDWKGKYVGINSPIEKKHEMRYLYEMDPKKYYKIMGIEVDI